MRIRNTALKFSESVRIVIDYADTVDTRFARKRKTRKTVFACSYGAQFFLF